MGVKRIYRKLKPTSRCVMGKTYSVTMTSAPCDCTEADFEWSVFNFHSVHFVCANTLQSPLLNCALIIHQIWISIIWDYWALVAPWELENCAWVSASVGGGLGLVLSNGLGVWGACGGGLASSGWVRLQGLGPWFPGSLAKTLLAWGWSAPPWVGWAFSGEEAYIACAACPRPRPGCLVLFLCVSQDSSEHSGLLSWVEAPDWVVSLQTLHPPWLGVGNGGAYWASYTPTHTLPHTAHARVGSQWVEPFTWLCYLWVFECLCSRCCMFVLLQVR